MEAHPDDRLVFGGAAFVVGGLFIAFAMITAFDVRYLFTGTLPFITVGVCFLAFGWHVFNKEDGDKVEGAQVRKHHVHIGENRRERRLREKRERLKWD